MTTQSQNTALIFGATGISGWSVARNALIYPTPAIFQRVIGLMHRPRTIEEIGLPEDPRLELYSGVDLSAELDDVIADLKKKIPCLEDVTHVYYLAYATQAACNGNMRDFRNTNVAMTYNAVHACDQLCERMKFFLLQTGTNAYGVAVFECPDKIETKVPLRENAPRIPSPWSDSIFYYAQVDLIKKANHGKSWKWCEVRPDQIVGEVPSQTSTPYVEPLSLYLALYRYLEGHGATVQFPGTQRNYLHTYTDVSPDTIARSEIYLSITKPEEAHGEAFNIADTDKPGSWGAKWSSICEYFGLKGGDPDNTGWKDIDQWWYDHLNDYERMCNEYGLEKREISPTTWNLVKIGHTLIDRNREFSLDKIRNLGFTETYAVGFSYFRVFESLERKKAIPPRDAMCMR